MIAIEIAHEADKEQLTTIEIESKIQSIPECVDAIEIDYDIRLYRWGTYFNGTSPASSKPPRIILKAVTDGTIIGYIAGHPTNRYSLDAEIQSFYILKEYQRNGTGKQLLKKFVEWLLTQPAKNLCAGIKPENKYQAFYLKYGGKHLNEHWIYWDDMEELVKQLHSVI
jgi:GNAT superfamily N-acetyltransferase